MKKNKSFIIWMKMISIAVVTMLLAGMFIGISATFKDKQNASSINTQDTVTNINTSTNALKNEIDRLIKRGVVEEIQENNLRILDIDRGNYIDVEKEKVAFVKDAYGSPMPFNTVEKGDLLAVTYGPDQEDIVGIEKLKDSWANKDIKNVVIDKINKKFYIGQSMYTVAENSLILNAQGGKIMLEDVGEYDTLEVKGLEEKIYSINVLEPQATIEITKLPSYEGIVEIDTNRHINLESINRPIPIKAGKHKVIIKMDGYKTIIKEIDAKAGEHILITPENAEKAYTEIVIDILNGVDDYTVEINQIVYKPEDIIKVAQGKHRIKASAEGYKSWVGDMILSDPIVKLNITLESLDNEQVVAEEGTTSANTSTISQGSTNILTEPSGAKVYIENQYKGTTPYNTYLSQGEHAIVLQKEGYEIYTTTLNMDENNKGDNLYVLTPKADSTSNGTSNGTSGGALDGLLDNLLNKSLEGSLGGSLSGLLGN